MTIRKARKVLGKNAESISDEELQKEIEVAQMLAEIVLKEYKKQKLRYD